MFSVILKQVLLSLFIQEECKGYDFAHSGFFALAVFIAHINNGIFFGEFGDNLAAGAAGGKEFFCIANNQDFSNLLLTVGHHLEDGIPFGTYGQTV
jgi:hypothetical protein